MPLLSLSRRWRRLVAQFRPWLDARYWWKRNQLDREIDDEMRFHIDMEARSLREKYHLSEAEARTRALATFGGQTRFKEEARADLPMQWLADVGGDVVFAIRSLRRTPGFTAVAVLAIALGIGANTTLFAVVDSVAFRPLDVRQPDQLRAVFSVGSDGTPQVLSLPVAEDIRNNVSALYDVAAFAERMVSVHGDATPVAAWAAHTTENYFSLLGLRPALGRLLQSGDARAPVAVLSHAFWTRSFGADPRIVGKTIRVNGFPFTIIGVGAASFHGTRLFTFAPELWLPVGMHAVTLPGSGDVLHDRLHARFHVFARLRQGETDAHVRRQLDALATRLTSDRDAGDVERIRFALYSNRTPIEPWIVSPERLALIGQFSLIAGWLVLLIACADVASLLMARMTARRREIATRVALGATTFRLVRQFLVESFVLGFVALLVALPMAAVAVRASIGLTPPLDFTSSFAPTLTLRSVLFSCVIALAALVLFGLAPLVHAGASSITPSMRGLDTRSRPSASRWRSALIAVQVATSILVLATAGLFARSLAAARKIDVGFDADRLVVFTADPSLLLGYDASRVDALYRRLTEELARLPGVVDVARATAIPLDGTTATLRVVGPTAGEPAIAADYYAVSDRYFDTMRIPLVAGRALSARDSVGVERVVVNETLARRLWPAGQFQIGTRVRLFAADGPEVEIVGVVATRTSRQLGDRPRPLLWRSLVRARAGRTTTIVRVEERPEVVMSAVRRAVESVAPDLPIVGLRTMREQIAVAYSAAESGAVSGSTLGLLATALAAAGIFGVVSFAASQRVREFGIRRALGARTAHLLGLTLRSGLQPTFVGLAIGLAGAFALPRGMSAILYGVSPRDPIALFGAATVFGFVALIAALIPAWRATRINPTRALQSE